MFRPKKTIPKLAVATMALTGCGGDGGGDCGDFDACVDAFCMNAAPCFPEYGTVEECIDYYTALNDYNADNPQCEPALLTYFNCSIPKSCNQLRGDACDTEYYATFVCD